MPVKTLYPSFTGVENVVVYPECEFADGDDEYASRDVYCRHPDAVVENGKFTYCSTQMHKGTCPLHCGENVYTAYEDDDEDYDHDALDLHTL